MEMFVPTLSAGQGGRQYKSWDNSGDAYGASVALAGKTLPGPAKPRLFFSPHERTDTSRRCRIKRSKERVFQRGRRCAASSREEALWRHSSFRPAFLLTLATGASTSCFRWLLSDGCHRYSCCSQLVLLLARLAEGGAAPPFVRLPCALSGRAPLFPRLPAWAGSHGEAAR